jgi:hypothetical protein
MSKPMPRVIVAAVGKGARGKPGIVALSRRNCGKKGGHRSGDLSPAGLARRRSIINGSPPTVRKGGRSMRHGILLALVFAMTAIAFASTAAADGNRSSCPNGYTAYAIPQTETELMQFPRIVAGLNADPAPYTAQELIAAADQIDANNDGIFCLKAVSNLRGASAAHWAYFYWARDNDTAAS